MSASKGNNNVYVNKPPGHMTMMAVVPISVKRSKKVEVGKDQEKRNQKEIPTPKTERGKNQTTNQALIP